MKHTIQIIVLAAGKGTRMGDTDKPKVLMDFAGRPLVSHILSSIAKANSEPGVILVTGFKSEQVEEVLAGNNYTFAKQEQQLGTGHAVQAALPYITADHVMVLYGDMPLITTSSIEKLIATHLNTNAAMTLFTTDPHNFDSDFSSLYSFGRIIRDEQGSVQRIIELKDAQPEEIQITEVNPGIYMFRSSWLKDNIFKIRNNNSKGEYYLTDLLEIAVDGGVLVKDAPLNPFEVLGVNTKDDLLLAEKIATARMI